MNKNISKLISKISFYGCWLAIILISFILLDSIASPWQKQYFGIKIPKIDPFVQIDNNMALPPHPSYFLKEKRKRYTSPRTYSIVKSESYHEVFYRSHYEGYPREALFILMLRIATFLVLAIFFFLLAQIMQSVYRGAPFTTSNFKRLLYMGLLMFFIPIIRSLHSAVLADLLSNSPRMSGWEITASLQSFWLLLFGVFFVIFGYVFKELVRIHEEQKLTV